MTDCAPGLLGQQINCFIGSPIPVAQINVNTKVKLTDVTLKQIDLKQ